MISCIVALYTLMPAYVADKRVLASAYCMNKKNVFINQNVQFMTDLQGLVDRLFACDPKHPPAITDREIIDAAREWSRIKQRRCCGCARPSLCAATYTGSLMI